jgi:mRNA interferase MazF
MGVVRRPPRVEGGWVITKQIRTASAKWFRRYAPQIQLSAAELNDVRHALAQMLIV